jgi:hypothetical protein
MMTCSTTDADHNNAASPPSDTCWLLSLAHLQTSVLVYDSQQAVD